MILLNLIKKNFSNILILFLVCLIWMQRSCIKPINITSPNTKILIDTVYKTKKNTIYKTLTIYKTIKPSTKILIDNKANEDYNVLKNQYDSLLINCKSIVIYKDTIKIEKGTIVVIDSVKDNKVQSRTYKEDYSLPVVINNVKSVELRKRQFYIGTNINFDRNVTLNNIQLGVLYKDKKDQIFGLNAGISPNMKLNFGISSYWKIKF